jgi:Fe-S-cluster containining protein
MRTVPECTGRCCDPVAMSAEQYAAMAADPANFLDGPQIVAMLTPRDATTTTFECSNFERSTARCRIYDQRPGVCVFYPNGRACPHCGGGGTGRD